MMERNDKSIAKGKCKTMKLGQLASFINGYPFKPSEWKEKGIPIIRIQNLNNDQAPYNYYDEGLPSKYIIESGDILISWSGSLGVFEWTKSKAYLNQHIFKVIFDKEEINKRFFQYAVESSLTEMSKHLHGATMKHIVKRDFINLPIPVPPLPVQARIVDELDCLQGILSKKRQQLAEYHSLAQAIFHQMFGDPVVNEKGWEVKKWKELFDTKLGKMLDRSQHTSSQKQYPYLANTNVQWGYFDLSDLRTMPFSDEELIKYDLEENDLLICEGGESGRCAIWHNKYSNQNILFQKAIHRARIKKANTVDITYISYFIRYSKELGGLKDYISKSTIEHLTGEKLKSLPIPLPPLPLQQSFAARIAAIDSQRERLAASIRELETLLACRMETLLNCPQA